jgi:hypothetical protein
VLTPFLANTREHYTVRVVHGPKTKVAAQTGQTGLATRLDVFLGLGSSRSFGRNNYHTYVMEDD